jgi:hypothetical protein
MRKINQINDAITAKAVIAERNKRLARSGKVLFDRTRQEVKEHDLNVYLEKAHDKQKEMLLAEARFKAVCCPRRTGKTTYNLFECMLHDLKFPGSTIVYIVPDSKAHAKDLFWLPLKELNAKLNLGLLFKEVEKRVITPRGTQILLLGAHDADSPTRLRGGAYSLALLDECKDFGPHFEELIVEAILPGLGDYGGTLVLSGTPGSVFQGLFYKVCIEQPDGWKVAKWIKSDNSFLRPEERDLDKVFETTYKPFGLTKDSPKFRREQLAEWVAEDSEKAYYYDPVRNFWDGSFNPRLEYQHICAIDLGKRDKTVIQPGAFSYQDENLYYMQPHAQRGMYIQTICEKWKEMDRRYGFVGTVVDTGGLGVMIVDDINMRYGFNWQAVDKSPKYKLGAVEQMNSDFLLGRIKAEPDSIVATAWAKSIKDPKTGLPIHSDEGDAALYLHRFSYHWTGKHPIAEPERESPVWWENQEREAINRALKNRQNRETEGPYGKALSDD